MTKVVSVTSMAVERDSRTYKFAASVARLGYESIVVEGEPSELPADGLPFRLVSPPSGPEQDGAAAPESAPDAPAREAPPATRGRPRLLARVVRVALTLLAPLVMAVAKLRNSLVVLRSSLREVVSRNRETSALLPEAEVYWLHSFPQLPSVYLKARRLRARFLYDTPDAYWEPGQTPAATRTVGLVMRAYEAIEGFGVRRAERFTSVSAGVGELLERRFGRRPEIVCNCHDPRLDQECERDIREVTGVAPEDFLLVMTGNLKPGMAVKQALLAMQKLPDRVHIAFVGRGHERSLGMVEELGLTGRAHLLRSVPPMQVVSFVRTADASPILYTAATENYRYALPNGFFHAIAAGLPVLFPPLPEIRALAVEHGLGVEIDPGNPDSIAAGVRLLCEDGERAARHRANAERAREQLSWEREEETLAEILRPSRSL
jgi:glycosyltransferase involved in cell wall biosynthesis